MMVFIGALDDKFDLKVRIRIVGQIIIASLMTIINADLLAEIERGWRLARGASTYR